MAYGKVRIDNMSGTVLGKDLVSVKFQKSGVDAEIENGNVVLIGDLVEGEREVRLATAPAKDSPLSKIALIATPELVKAQKYTVLEDFINEAGSISRGYRLTNGCIFSVSAACLTGTAAVKNVVELAASSTKLKVVASATASTTTVGKVIAIEGDWIVIEVDSTVAAE